MRFLAPVVTDYDIVKYFDIILDVTLKAKHK